MAKVKPRVKVPKKADAGEVITIKTLISHPMESGQRKDKEGKIIPRQIINNFKAEYNGNMVFQVDLEPAVSANPYIEFNALINEAGTFKFTWLDDDGSVYETENEVALS